MWQLWPGRECDCTYNVSLTFERWPWVNTLDNGQQLCEILFRSNKAVRIYEPDTNFGCVHCDHDLRDMIWSQGHDPSLGHGQQLCMWNIVQIQQGVGLISYDPDKKANSKTDRRTNGQSWWFCIFIEIHKLISNDLSPTTPLKTKRKCWSYSDVITARLTVSWHRIQIR